MIADVTLQTTVEDLSRQLAEAKQTIEDLHLSSMRDSSERNRLESRLRHSRKMEAIGILVGAVAHDFNNLLSIMVTYSTFALEALQPSDPLYSDVQQIANAGERAVALTRPLLAFSLEQILEPAVIDLNALLTAILPMLRRALPEGIGLHLRNEPALGGVSADPGQLEQVIINLVVNASDAMPDGGELTIETANVAADESAVDQLKLTSGAYVKLSVTDTGSGIDLAMRARIFEPFFSTKERAKHPGLGLSTVLGIVEQCGGRVTVQSVPGEGSSFEVLLPRDDSPVSRKA